MINLELFNNNKSVYGKEYQNHLIEQYKLYVDMTDRISSRRMIANSFFLTINAGFITFTTKIVSPETLENQFHYSILSLLAVIVCMLWFFTISSYKQLNSVRFKVIEIIETIMPIAPYKTEWNDIKKIKGYIQFTNIESYVPLAFIFYYYYFFFTTLP